MRHRTGQLDVAHALTPHLGKRHFNTALFTDHTTVLEALVLAAQAFVILDRAENLCAEQAITFRLESTVVNSLRLFDFTVGPGMNQVRRSQTNTNSIKVFVVTLRL